MPRALAKLREDPRLAGQPACVVVRPVIGGAQPVLADRAGPPSARLHDLRHTAASLLLAQGVPARVVMEILGHSQIALTMKTYSHVAPEVSREAADRMARMLWRDADEDQADDEGSTRGDD